MVRCAAIFLFGSIFMVGCGKEEPIPPQHPNHPPGGGNGGNNPGSTPNPDSQEWVLNPETAGIISGTILLEGKRPKVREIDMGAHSHCKKEDKPVYSESVVAGPNGELKNCFVYIKSGLEKYKFAIPPEPVLLDQDGCMYKPHVLGIMAGQTFRIRNSDDTSHNIHATPKINPEWNFSQNGKGVESDRFFQLPEIMVFIKCEVHGWMGCYVGVLSHPFYAVTDEKGRFVFSPLNPGHYELEIWHEKYGTQKASVHLDAKGQVALDLKYSTGN